MSSPRSARPDPYPSSSTAGVASSSVARRTETVFRRIWRFFGGFAPYAEPRGSMRYGEAWLADIVPWSESSSAIWRTAFQLASLRGQQYVEEEHVTYALLDDDEVKEALERAGADLDVVRQQALARMNDPAAEGFRVPGLSGALVHLVLHHAVAVQKSSRSDELEPLDLVATLLGPCGAHVPLLQSGGVAVGDFLRWHCHGQARFARPSLEEPLADLVSVVLHNDDFTPQQAVTNVLVEIAGMEPNVAWETMMAVHENGEAEVAVLARAEAVILVNRIVDYGELHGLPLRASLAGVPED